VEEQELLENRREDNSPSILTVAAVVIGLVIAGHNAWSFASEQAWLYLVAAGLAPPLVGLIEWARLRRRSDEARYVADRLIWLVLFAAAVVSL
jgi:hypothetical protein